MTVINFIRNDDSSDLHIVKIMSELKTEVAFFEVLNSTFNHQPLIIEVNKENIQSIISMIKNRDVQLIIAFKSKSDFKLIDHFKKDFENVFGFIDLSLEFEYNIPIVKNYMNIFFTKNMVNIKKLNSDLDKIFEFTQTELSRVKELHDRFIKLRTEKLKNGKIQIKFMAGEKSGGEFFDYIDTDSEINMITVGTDSYITASLIISEVENLKNKKNKFDTEILSFIAKINSIALEANSKINYLVTSLSITKSEITYYQKGMSKLYFNNELRTISANGTIKINRNEKFYILSEGLMKNWNLYNKESDLKSFLNKNLEMNTKDFINELFFELARHTNSSFLTFDALMVVCETNTNIIQKV